MKPNPAKVDSIKNFGQLKNSKDINFLQKDKHSNFKKTFKNHGKSMKQ